MSRAVRRNPIEAAVSTTYLPKLDSKVAKSTLLFTVSYDPISQYILTLIILTEQAFLNRGRFNFVLDTQLAEGCRKNCVQAALSIWKLVESYKRSFTLRRAQYGISYATYCAALVMLQHTSHESNEHVECIQFLWTALSDYQKGTCYGLKRPLKLLRSLMRRLGGRIGPTTEELPMALPTPASEYISSFPQSASTTSNFIMW